MEVTIVVAIIAILSSLGFTSYRSLKSQYDLTQAANDLYADIEWVRQRSMGNAYCYGLGFSPNTYTIFEDINGDLKLSTGDHILKTVNFSNITLSGYPGVNNHSYVYTRRGTARSSFTLTLTSSYGHFRQIKVSQFKTRIIP